jgi:large subunit ribosomal protein L17
MRHFKVGRKLNRTTAHRKSLLKNLAIAIFTHKIIKTTHAKAKEVQKKVEKIISLGKKNTVASRRTVFKMLSSRSLVKEIFHVIATKYLSREGGYTQVLKCKYRLGDGACISIIKLI